MDMLEKKESSKAEPEIINVKITYEPEVKEIVMKILN